MKQRNFIELLERSPVLVVAPPAAPTSRLMEITPAVAEKWLKKNHPSNRPMVWTRVESFQGDMTDGAWAVTHQGIAFDAEGYLIDGQHRLWAVVRSGTTVTMMVTHGLGVFGDPIDRNRPRSLAMLSGLGTKITAAVNTLRMLEQGMHLVVPMTLHETRETAEHHAAALEAIRAVPGALKLAAGMFGGAVYAYPINPEAVTAFVTQVATGEMIRKGDPAYALRAWRDRTGFSRDNWGMAMAMLNCVRYHLEGGSLTAVFVTPMGYRILTARRRAMKIPHTPSHTLVPVSPGE